MLTFIIYLIAVAIAIYIFKKQEPTMFKHITNQPGIYQLACAIASPFLLLVYTVGLVVLGN